MTGKEPHKQAAGQSAGQTPLSKPSLQKGMNLIELMVVLLIVAIILGAGIPALNSTVARNSVRAEANRIVGSVNFARSQAVSKQQTVTLNRRGDIANDWTAGWTIYSDAGGEGNQDINLGDGDVLLKDFTVSSRRVAIQVDNDGDNWITFGPSGRTAEAGDVRIAVCTTDVNDTVDGSLVTINRVGRVNVSTIDAGAADRANQCAPR